MEKATLSITNETVEAYSRYSQKLSSTVIEQTNRIASYRSLLAHQQKLSALVSHVLPSRYGMPEKVLQRAAILRQHSET